MPPSVGQATGEERCSRRSCSEHAAITGMDSADCTSGYQPCEFDSLLDAFLILITCRAYLHDIVVFGLVLILITCRAYLRDIVVFGSVLILITCRVYLRDIVVFGSVLILITCRAYLRDIVVFSSVQIGLLYLAYPGGIS